jgi:hypothetical protein
MVSDRKEKETQGHRKFADPPGHPDNCHHLFIDYY